MALDLSQHYPSIVRCSMGTNSIIGDETVAKFKLIKPFIVVLLICMNEEDPFKIESTRVVTTFSHYMYMGISKTLKGSYIHRPRSHLVKLRTHPRFYRCPCCQQE